MPRDYKEPCVNCPYQRDRARFNNAPFAATTFDRYTVDPACHGKCQVLFVDESASLESKLVSQGTVQLNDKIDPYHLRETLIAYQVELEEEIERLTLQLDELYSEGAKILDDRVLKVKKDIKRTKNEYGSIGSVVSHIDKGHKYIIDKEKQFRLLAGKDMFEELIENLDHVILASGTPTSSLYASEYKTVRVQHPIDIDRRLIHYTPVGSMSFQERKETIPLMATRIEDLHAKHHKKTMVHCGAYSIAGMLYDYMSAKGKDIAILQSDASKREAYKEEFLQATDEKIFLSVNFCEGLDLKGPEYPLNIIAKIPYENIGDEFVAARNKMDNWQRYTMFAAVNVMQASGRCTRSPNDFSETYILDSGWNGLRYKAKDYIEPWFKAAIRSK